MLHDRIIGKYVRIPGISRNIWHKRRKLPSLFFHVIGERKVNYKNDCNCVYDIYIFELTVLVLYFFTLNKDFVLTIYKNLHTLLKVSLLSFLNLPFIDCDYLIFY